MSREQPDGGVLDRAQARAERSRLGRALLSLVILTILATLAVSSLLEELVPGAADRARVTAAMRPLMNSTGLDQRWNVFSPNPRSIVLSLHARVTMSDGTVERWDMPGGDAFVSPYRIYRWRKWLEYARADDRAGQLFYPTADWIARSHAERDRHVVRVTLVRNWYDIPPPGEAPPAWRGCAYYWLNIAPNDLPDPEDACYKL